MRVIENENNNSNGERRAPAHLHTRPSAAVCNHMTSFHCYANRARSKQKKKAFNARFTHQISFVNGKENSKLSIVECELSSADDSSSSHSENDTEIVSTAFQIPNYVNENSRTSSREFSSKQKLISTKESNMHLRCIDKVRSGSDLSISILIFFLIL